MSRPVIIDRIDIRLPNGWQGDPTQLARKVAEQIQRQAAGLRSSDRLRLDLRGPFAGVESRVGAAIADQLSTDRTESRARSNDR